MSATILFQILHIKSKMAAVKSITFGQILSVHSEMKPKATTPDKLAKELSKAYKIESSEYAKVKQGAHKSKKVKS